jgi:hypothetical protein
VDSEVGHGTRFVVRLFAPAVTRRPNPRRTRVDSRLRSARRTILVVDDLDDQRDIVVQLLTPLGFDVAEPPAAPMRCAGWRCTRPTRSSWIFRCR